MTEKEEIGVCNACGKPLYKGDNAICVLVGKGKVDGGVYRDHDTSDGILESASEAWHDLLFCSECGEKRSSYLRCIVPEIDTEAQRKERERCVAIVNTEPELTDIMPDEMWETIRNDRDAVTEALRLAVRLTKASIIERVNRE